MSQKNILSLLLLAVVIAAVLDFAQGTYYKRRGYGGYSRNYRRSYGGYGRTYKSYNKPHYGSYGYSNYGPEKQMVVKEIYIPFPTKGINSYRYSTGYNFMNGGLMGAAGLYRHHDDDDDDDHRYILSNGLGIMGQHMGVGALVNAGMGGYGGLGGLNGGLGGLNGGLGVLNGGLGGLNGGLNMLNGGLGGLNGGLGGLNGGLNGLNGGLGGLNGGLGGLNGGLGNNLMGGAGAFANAGAGALLGGGGAGLGALG